MLDKQVRKDPIEERAEHPRYMYSYLLPQARR